MMSKCATQESGVSRPYSSFRRPVPPFEPLAGRDIPRCAPLCRENQDDGDGTPRVFLSDCGEDNRGPWSADSTYKCNWASLPPWLLAGFDPSFDFGEKTEVVDNSGGDPFTDPPFDYDV